MYRFKWLLPVPAVAVLVWIFVHVTIPDPLFQVPYATVVNASNGQLLSARIATDGQWRFPPGNTIPEKYRTAVLLFEDRWFDQHPGINPVSTFRALRHNLKSGSRKIGGSTLTQQVVRLSRKGKRRTVPEKAIEAVQALYLETVYSKDEIFRLYASHAPFGGNVVGLEAASWKYFGRNAHELSWAEAALLAVLPNSPRVLYPGKNDSALKEKRDRLLNRLFEKGVLDSLSMVLAVSESIPETMQSLPEESTHALEFLAGREGSGKEFNTTLNAFLQARTVEILNRHNEVLRLNEIHNLAALVLDVKTGNVLSYVGNAVRRNENGTSIDMIPRPRSTGSLLKPMLYTLMMHHGMLLPGTLVADIPIRYQGFSPENYNKQFSGAVPAAQALAKSLNVPAVKLLHEFSVPLFLSYLREMGLERLQSDPSFYGLSLILGGGESSLWELTSVYADFARTANESAVLYPGRQRYLGLKPKMLQNEPDQKKTLQELDPGAVFAVLNALQQVDRPEEDAQWEYFNTSRRIAWKTGTSFGHRDGWAIGVTPEYAIGVWVGNASGEGRPDLTGIKAAAPVLFDLFSVVDETTWFEAPVFAMDKVPVCRQSGHRTGQFCETADTVWIPKPGLQSPVCPYHQKIWIDPFSGKQMNSNCDFFGRAVAETRFVLPPVMEWFYKPKHPEYLGLPDLSDGCGRADQASRTLAFIYPHAASRIIIPRELDGKKGAVVLEAAHRDRNAVLFWHLDETFIGQTHGVHQISVSPPAGTHRITIVDAAGNRLQRSVDFFEAGIIR